MLVLLDGAAPDGWVSGTSSQLGDVDLTDPNQELTKCNKEGKVDRLWDSRNQL